MIKKLPVIIALLIANLNVPEPSAAKVYIDIRSPSATRLPILVPDFKNTGRRPDPVGLTSKMARTVSDDLEFSGFFIPLDPSAVDDSYLDGLTRDKIKWDILTVIGAEAIVTGGFEILPGDALATELRLFDAVQGRFITGKKYKGRVEDYRLISHRFSNEIFFRMSGEKGVFETRIAFVKKTGGNKELHVMDYDGSDPRQITRFNSLSLSPAWSPTGRQIAFTSYRDGNPDLYTIDLSSGKTIKISHKRGVNIAPSWSPDNTKIALTLSLNNGNSEIYTINIETKKLKRLTRNWATDVSPTWSPDGEKVAFVSSRSGSPQIFCLNLKTGRTKRLTYEGNYNTTPDWSPQGEQIAYTGLADGQFNIYVISENGQHRRRLTNGRGNSEEPAWSPDGRFIAFSSNRTGQKEIYIMRADGTGQKKITLGPGDKSEPAWSPF